MTTQEFTRIHREMTIAEIFSQFPERSQRLAQAMTNSGLNCSNCSAATFETLEAGVLGHGYSEDKLEKLINDLNSILEEEIDFDSITLTPRAAEKFASFAKEEGKEGYGLRFGDSAGGCGGFQYILDFCNCAEENDTTFLSEGITIYVNSHMVNRLKGAQIDYVDGLQGAGFKISNPNVKSSCSCGTSQGY